MRKRFVTTFIISCLCAVCAVVFAACSSTDVSGKTYVFSDVSVSENEWFTADDLREGYEGLTITFNADGTVSSEMFEDATWSQSGSDVTVTEDYESTTFKVSGNKLTYSGGEDGITITVTFKVQN